MREHRLFSGLPLLPVVPRVLLAHEGEPPVPHDLWSAWSWEPVVLLALTLAGWSYAQGVRALWRRAGVGRGVRRWQAGAFAGGLAALFVALVTPLDALGEALFAAHMVQHLVLALIAAPLLALGAPHLALLWALPLEGRRSLARWWRRSPRLRTASHALTHPLLAWILSTFALWAWHVPFYYDAAVRSDPVHALEHASFFGTALLFWWALADPAGVFRRARGAALLYVFTGSLQSAALGALLTLAPEPWYGAHLETTRPWGLSPLQDQHIAGGIMWVPASMVYLVALVGLFVLCLREAARNVERAERRRTRSRGGAAVIVGVASAAVLAGCPRPGGESAVAGGDPGLGRAALAQYGCGSCHTIPGVRQATGKAGPPLDNWARRGFIAGALVNTPESLILWIMDPQAVEPGTVMPNLGVREADARHIAAYLYTLE